jgi:hypothetical protein
MGDFRAARDKANAKIKIADHMLTQTYPLVMDPKLLLAVIDNLFLALVNGMNSILYYDREFKRVPPFVENFENKFRLFREKCAARHRIDKEYIKLMQDVKDIIVAHSKSPIEFARKDSFVICSDKYRMKTIYLERIKKYVELTKRFLSETSVIVSRDERIIV